ncbi:MAG: methyltransferase, FxLD system [Ardenticatenaceae bacterium]|nr:methyltransferase, FxLD system [Ardenticatenaceae bacterium]
MSNPSDAANFYHQALIDKLTSDKLIQSSRVEAAFRAVPRHHFLPDIPLEKAYKDDAIPTKMENGRAISSSSQPAMMAIMLEQLDLQPGHRVLEIGAGTGYNAAIMAHIVGETGRVTTLDIDEDIVLAAREHVAAAAVPAPVHVICADGTLGWVDQAPYDRIILTVGGWDISPAWVEQLAANGRLLLPLSLNGPQLSVAFDRENGRFVSQSVAPCGFMRLRGPFTEPEYILTLGPIPNLTLQAITPLPDQADAIYQWLQQPAPQQRTRITLTRRKLGRDLAGWLALRERHFCHLVAHGEAADVGLVPPLFQTDSSKWQSSMGLWAKESLAVLAPQKTNDPARIELAVCGFGPQATAAQRLWTVISEWERNGRPTINDLSITAYPLNHPYQPSPDERIIPKQWQQFVLRWQ